MPPAVAILSTASTTPLLSTRRAWPLKHSVYLSHELSHDVITSSSSSTSYNGTNVIALVALIIALLTLILSSVVVGVYHKYSYPRLNHQKISTTADPNEVVLELQDRHHDFEVGNDVDEEEGEEEKEEQEQEELHSLERAGYHLITNNKNQVHLCIAQAVRVYPPGSASMVDIRNSDHGAWYTIDGLPNSRSVRDVSTLPDLSSARAIISRRSDDVLGRRGRKDIGARDEFGGYLCDQHKKNKREPTMRTVMPPEENGKGLRQALKKRISTPRFGFQGGSVRELVRSIGF